MKPGSHRVWAPVLVVASFFATSTPAPWAREAHGQIVYAGPEIGGSQRRGPTVGARVGLEVIGGFDVVGQLLVFFPEEAGVAEPAVDVSRSLWHGSTNLMYVFDRGRAVAPYVGAGVRYGRASLSVVVDGLRAADVRDGFSANVLGGIRLPRLPGRPFLEYRGRGGGGWVLTAGASVVLASR